MTVGGTWGFMLDMTFGTDEGFREYLWASHKGLQYAFGSLVSPRYARYLVTILFDMFFTTILFKKLYARLVLAAGFTVKGREWIANGFVSTLISVMTFEVRRRAPRPAPDPKRACTHIRSARGARLEPPPPLPCRAARRSAARQRSSPAARRAVLRRLQVYANMTRFQWAYPSGVGEGDRDAWLSGPETVLIVVVMNMVFLNSETRTRVGEPGINDPKIKLFVTFVNFFILVLLIDSGLIHPANDGAGLHGAAANGTADSSAPLLDPKTDPHLPLAGVCATQYAARYGMVVFSLLVLGCFTFVIFLTAAQSLSGLRRACCCGGGGGGGDGGGASRRRDDSSADESARVATTRNPAQLNERNEAVMILALDEPRDRQAGKLVLLLLYLTIVLLIVLVFACACRPHPRAPTPGGGRVAALPMRSHTPPPCPPDAEPSLPPHGVRSLVWWSSRAALRGGRGEARHAQRRGVARGVR